MKDKKHTTGFTVPEHYFDGMEDRLMEIIHEASLPKKSGFTVPQGYFEEIEETILRNLPTIQTETTKVIPLYKRAYFVAAASIAACVVLLFSNVQSSSETTLTIKEIQTESIASYIDDGNLDLSAHEITLLLSEDAEYTFTSPSEDISNENLTEYLLNTLEDTTLLFE